jgi:hypothetical protein
LDWLITFIPLTEPHAIFADYADDVSRQKFALFRPPQSICRATGAGIQRNRVQLGLQP